MSTTPRITAPYKIDAFFAEVSLNKSSEAFKTCYELTTFGILYKASFSFNSKDIILKLSINSETVFEIDLRKLKDTKDENSFIFFDDATDTFFFRPSYPIMFKSVLVEAKSNGNSTSRKLEAAILEYTKE